MLLVAAVVAIPSTMMAGGISDQLREEGFLDGPDLRTRAEKSLLARESYLTNREAGAIGIGGGPDATLHVFGILGTAEHELTGTIQYSDGSVGTVLDVERDLGIRKTDTERFGGQFRIGFLRLTGSYQKYDLEGQGTGNFTFGNVAFTGTTDTKISVTNYTAEIGFTFDLGLFELGFGIGAHVYDMSFRVTGTEQITNLTRTEENDFIGPVPVLGLHGGFSIWNFAFEPAVQVIKAPEISGVEGLLYDLSLLVKFYVIDNVAVGVEGGYTFMNVEKKDGGGNTDSTNGDLELTSTRISLVVGVSF